MRSVPPKTLIAATIAPEYERSGIEKHFKPLLALFVVDRIARFPYLR